VAEVLFHKNSVECYLILVDADTGAILYRTNLVHFSQPQGLVFPKNPDASKGKQSLRTFPERWFSQPSLGGNNVCVQEDRDNTNRGRIIRKPGYRPTSEEGQFLYPFTDAYFQSRGTDVDTDLDAALTNVFYWVNRLHDYFYDLGFTESEWNFQAADFASGWANQEIIWKAFACRGMGLSASTVDHNDENPVEAFDLPTGGTCSPDLLVTTVSNPPSSAVRGTSLTVTETIRNRNEAPAKASRTRYYLSLDATWNSGDTRLTGRRDVPALAPRSTDNGTANVTIPANTAPGRYFLLACADDFHTVAESKEQNNCTASATQVKVTR
jgi:hypothetical protein